MKRRNKRIAPNLHIGVRQPHSTPQLVRLLIAKVKMWGPFWMEGGNAGLRDHGWFSKRIVDLAIKTGEVKQERSVGIMVRTVEGPYVGYKRRGDRRHFSKLVLDTRYR